MTYSTFTSTARIILASVFLSLGTQAIAADAPAYRVQSAADSHIRASVKAFKKGKYQRSIVHSHAAIKKSLSPKRAAIAYSNLCAAYGQIGEIEKAKAACDEALTLRPNFALAQNNRENLKTSPAQLAKN